MRSSDFTGRLANTRRRRSSSVRARISARRRSASSSYCSGSVQRQCAVIGWPGPGGRRLARRRVAQREHEIEWRRIRRAEFAHVLRRMIGHRQPGVLQQFRRDGIDARGRTHAGAECLELPAADGIRDGFGDHAARRISLRKKQHTEWRAFHGILLARAEIRATVTTGALDVPVTPFERARMSAHARRARRGRF